MDPVRTIVLIDLYDIINYLYKMLIQISLN